MAISGADATGEVDSFEYSESSEQRDGDFVVDVKRIILSVVAWQNGKKRRTFNVMREFQ